MSEKKKKQLSPTSMKLAEHSRLCYRIYCQRGTILQDVLHPTFWEHHFKKLEVGTKIEVMLEDLSWYGELLVLGIDDREVTVRPIHYTPFSPDAEISGEVNELQIEDDIATLPVDQKYIIEFIPGKNWMVRVDEEGSEWMGEQHSTERLAKRWVREHKKALRR